MKICIIHIYLSFVGVNSLNYILQVPKNIRNNLVRRFAESERVLRDGHLVLQRQKEVPTRNRLNPSEHVRLIKTSNVVNLEPTTSRTGLLNPHELLKENFIRRPVAIRSNGEAMNDSRNVTKRLAYKEDLDKLLEELKQKYAKNQTSNQEDHGQDHQLEVNGSTTKTSNVPKDIGRLVQLLKKGTNMTQNFPESNVDVQWLKIKVPKP